MTKNEPRDSRPIKLRSRSWNNLDKKAGSLVDALDRLRAEYQDRLQQLELCAENPDDCSGQLATPQLQSLQHEALQVERQTIIQLRNRHVINDDALRRIQRDLDLAEARLTG